MTGTAQQETGHQHTSAQKREDLLHETPGGIHPVFALILGEPGFEHKNQHDQQQLGTFFHVHVPWDGGLAFRPESS
jgi:hypothetical protein